MLKNILLAGMISGALFGSCASFAASMDAPAGAASGAGGQTPMMNSNDPASNTMMQNGTVQQRMPLNPSAHGSSLKDSAEADQQRKMMMQQQNSSQ